MMIIIVHIYIYKYNYIAVSIAMLNYQRVSIYLYKRALVRCYRTCSASAKSWFHTVQISACHFCLKL